MIGYHQASRLLHKQETVQYAKWEIAVKLNTCMYCSDKVGVVMMRDATALSMSSASPLATEREMRQEVLREVRLVGTSGRELGPVPLAISTSIECNVVII